MKLREKVESWWDDQGDQTTRKAILDSLESFARAIRNEALEEAKRSVLNPKPSHACHFVTLEQASERITALIAKEYEK